MIQRHGFLESNTPTPLPIATSVPDPGDRKVHFLRSQCGWQDVRFPLLRGSSAANSRDVRRISTPRPKAGRGAPDDLLRTLRSDGMGQPKSGIHAGGNLRFSLLLGAAAIAGLAAAHLCVADERGQTANAARLPSTTSEKERLVLSAENTSRCVTCHRFERTMNHPIQVSPVLATPASLPLVDGQVACVTCHDASPDHRSAEVHVGQRMQNSTLCVSCHQGTPATSRTVHAMSTKKAHLQGDSRPSIAHGSGEVDNESMTCMECHDGTLGEDAGAHTGGLGSGDKSEHPIGVAMRFGQPTRGSDFRLALRVDKRVRLFEGTVGCGSCHSPYSLEQGQLVINNRGSALCLTCHTQ